jgi:hypothetical protein
MTFIRIRLVWALLSSVFIIWWPGIDADFIPRTVSPLTSSYTAVTWPYEGTVLAAAYQTSGAIILSTDKGLTW